MVHLIYTIGCKHLCYITSLQLMHQYLVLWDPEKVAASGPLNLSCPDPEGDRGSRPSQKQYYSGSPEKSQSWAIIGMPAKHHLNGWLAGR